MWSLNYFQKLNKFFKFRKTLLYNNNRIYNFVPDINNLYFYLKLNCVTMKKVLLASSLLLASMSSAFAQVPDASGWNKIKRKPSIIQAVVRQHPKEPLRTERESTIELCSFNVVIH